MPFILDKKTSIENEKLLYEWIQNNINYYHTKLWFQTKGITTV